MSDEKIIARANPVDSALDKIRNESVKQAQSELDKALAEAYKAYQVYENAKHAVTQCIDKLEDVKMKMKAFKDEL